MNTGLVSQALSVLRMKINDETEHLSDDEALEVEKQLQSWLGKSIKRISAGHRDIRDDADAMAAVSVLKRKGVSPEMFDAMMRRADESSIETTGAN